MVSVATQERVILAAPFLTLILLIPPTLSLAYLYRITSITALPATPWFSSKSTYYETLVSSYSKVQITTHSATPIGRYLDQGDLNWVHTGRRLAPHLPVLLRIIWNSEVSPDTDSDFATHQLWSTPDQSVVNYSLSTDQK